MIKYTLEPWKAIIPTDGRPPYLRAKKAIRGEKICKAVPEGMLGFSDKDVMNMRRIAAAINCSSGFSTEELENREVSFYDVLSQMRLFLNHLQGSMDLSEDDATWVTELLDLIDGKDTQ